MNVTFIGGGNMATALIAGLASSPDFDGEIRVCDPSPQARTALATAHDVVTTDDPATVVDDSQVIVLAVKPQIMPLVLQDLAPLVSDSQLVLSIAAGTTIDTIKTALGPGKAVIRCMPNTPALLGCGISGVFASAEVSDQQKRQAEQILEAAGEVVWITEEELMDAVTAISGSGPAYFFLMTEALAEAGRKLGLPTDTAKLLALHTARGAGEMLVSGSTDAAELRRRVTSPGGTTQAAIEFFQANGFEEMVDGAARSARDRGRELAATGATGD